MKQFLKRLVSEHCVAVAFLLAALLAVVVTIERRRIFGKMSPAEFSIPSLSEHKQVEDAEARTPWGESQEHVP